MKYSDDLIRAVKEDHEAGMSNINLAKKYNINIADVPGMLLTVLSVFDSNFVLNSYLECEMYSKALEEINNRLLTDPENKDLLKLKTKCQLLNSENKKSPKRKF